jgi:hypothetical protein
VGRTSKSVRLAEDGFGNPSYNPDEDFVRLADDDA